MRFLHVLLSTSIIITLSACSGTRRGQWREVSPLALPQTEVGVSTKTIEQEKLELIPNAKNQQVISRETTVAPGFEIEMKSPDDVALNGKFKVDDEGKIRLPYAITVPVAGMNAEQLREAIINAYAEFFRSPSRIQVRISQAQVYVEVGGLVQKPGRYLVKPQASLDELIGLAGGLLTNAERALMARYARVDRGTAGAEYIRLADYYAGSMQYSPDWNGGERIFLQSEGGATGVGTSAAEGADPVIQFLGSVKNPGEFKYDNRLDFYGYLSKAGGPTPEADLENIEVIRNVGIKKQALLFSMRTVEQVPTLQAGDILIIHANSPNYAITNSASIIGALAAIVIAIFASQ